MPMEDRRIESAETAMLRLVGGPGCGAGGTIVDYRYGPQIRPQYARPVTALPVTASLALFALQNVTTVARKGGEMAGGHQRGTVATRGLRVGRATYQEIALAP
jgi:hypothetical protein